MASFKGFQGDSERYIRLRSSFFTDLVPLVEDLAELKLLLYAVWALAQKDGDYRYLRARDFETESLLEQIRQTAPDSPPEETLRQALELAVQQGAMLSVSVPLETGPETLYFMNAPDGRAAVRAVEAGQWRPGDLHNPVEILPERPNIYQLYEANIGSITPMIAEELKDAEVEFPALWLEEAIRLAVAHNKRAWKYARAILDRWAREGRDRGLTGRFTQQDGQEYVSGQFAAFIDNRSED